MSFLSLPAVLALFLVMTPGLAQAQIRDGRLPGPGNGRVIIDAGRSDEDSDEDSDSDSDSDADSDSDSERSGNRRDGRAGTRAGDICVDRNRDGMCDSSGSSRGRRTRDDLCVDRNRDRRCDGRIGRSRMEEILGSVIRGGRYAALAVARRFP